MIIPTLEVLPVYVRGGSIFPIEPLTQSIEETPKGPLTLRIYRSASAGSVQRALIPDRAAWTMTLSAEPKGEPCNFNSRYRLL